MERRSFFGWLAGGACALLGLRKAKAEVPEEVTFTPADNEPWIVLTSVGGGTLGNVQHMRVGSEEECAEILDEMKEKNVCPSSGVMIQLSSLGDTKHRSVEIP